MKWSISGKVQQILKRCARHLKKIEWNNKNMIENPHERIPQTDKFRILKGKSFKNIPSEGFLLSHPTISYKRKSFTQTGQNFKLNILL